MRSPLWHLFANICLLLIGCSNASRQELFLFDFETDADLDRLQWHCKTMYTRSREHTTHGAYSLRVDFYPSLYPRFEPLLHRQDWSKYRALCFDVYNPSDIIIPVTLRIDDPHTSSSFYDCYIEHLKLWPGKNAIVVSISDLKGHKTQRPLQITAIQKVMVFMSRPRMQHTLYFDNIKLVP